MTARALVFVVLVALGVDAFAACTDNTPTCIPDTVANDCICNQGDRGHRVCDKDGLHFGECACGLAGTGGGSGAAGDANTGGGDNAGSSGLSNTGGKPDEAGAAGDFTGMAGGIAAGGV